jgi:death on curing protein
VAVRYLSVADVIALHTQTMERMGERAASVRDPALLESAILRPQMAAHYEEADLERQAALLAVGISQNQPFIDGNKRAAYIALVTFLRVNGRPFTGNPLDLARELEAVATRLDSLEAATHRFEQWLREHIG